MAKNELIEEANNFISEFAEEKHELKAKFKLLTGMAMNPDESVSSYKSTD
jgi:predicted PolB exonuclease-like 3'-5' exonuclease